MPLNIELFTRFQLATAIQVKTFYSGTSEDFKPLASV